MDSTLVRKLCFIFFNDTATTEIYTLSLHDALPICGAPAERPARRTGRRGPGGAARRAGHGAVDHGGRHRRAARPAGRGEDRKSTRLNSSHANISYAVFCLKKNHLYTLMSTASKHD